MGKLESMELVDFNKFKAKNLNSSQLQAIEKDSGILQVIAGAGSGKTRVITSRIANLLINHNVQPNEIVALTFTNKAGNEMKERILSWLPHGAPLPFIGTFHSFCLKLLKKHLGYSFTIMDNDDQKKLIDNLMKKFDLKKRYTSKGILYAISLQKNSALSKNANEFQDPILNDVVKLYEKEKNNSKCLDFDDLIIETVKLFRKNKKFKSEFQQTVRHLLIDEYQDTSLVQHELLKEMATSEAKMILKSLCIVGDEDQSIYSWRGARYQNILNFESDFPGAKVITLDQNYRSTNLILQAANSLIQKNNERLSLMCFLSLKNSHNPRINEPLYNPPKTNVMILR